CALAPRRRRQARESQAFADDGAKTPDQCRPPVTCSVSPVTYDASFDAKKATAAAISSTLPIRPSGVTDSIHLRMSPSARPAETTPSVAIMPGLTVLTRILRGANSFESTEEMASTEAFVA